MPNKILDFIDFERVNTLLEGFNQTTGFVTAILDLEGNVLSKSGWRTICTDFHRVNPETAKRCTVSDTVLANKLSEGDKYHFYQCINGLVDVAVPIMMRGDHVANLFTGQFFFEKPDRSFFKKQAEKYGFNERDYFKALDKVPIISQKKVKTAMNFLLKMTEMISEITFQKLEQIELNEAIRKNEKALSESETFIKSVMNNLPIGIAVNSVDPAVNFTYMNDNFPKFYRTTREKLEDPDMFWDSVYEDPVFREEMKKKVLNDCASGDPENMYWQDVPIARKGKEISYVSARNTPIPDKQLMISTVWDVTHRKEVEEALIENERKYKMLIENLPQKIFYKDKNSVYLTCNQNYANDLKIKPEEIIGKTDNDFYPVELAEKYKSDDRRIIESGGTEEIEEEYVLDSRKAIVQTVKTAARDSQGKVIGLLGIFWDITRQRQLEEQLQQAQKMEAIGTLAGGIAHDFNNILFPLMGYAELLQEDLPQDSLHQNSIEEMLKAAMRAKELVKQILAFSRQGEGELKPVRLQSLLKEALKLLGSSIPTTIDIQNEIDPDCGLVIADPTQIHQVIMNLATNAFHAMQESGGQLKISLTQIKIESQPEPFFHLAPGNYALLKVIDTGVGIEKKIMDKIFDPYFTTKPSGKGTGLGLSIVKGIAKRCNGDIHVYSELDKGTEIHVYLPIIEKKSDISIPARSQPVQGGTERILIVDDEEAIIKMEKEMLERMGYHVTSKISSRKAFETFMANPDDFDLVISDMTMPDMTGVQLAKKIETVRPDIPFILCTGFSDNIDEKSSQEIGIKGYLGKPIIRKELAQKIREVLNS